jgi:hypothetical protein
MATKPKRARSSTGGVNWSVQLANDLKYAEKCLLSQGDVIPMFVIHTKARVLILECPWKNDDDKERYYMLAKTLCIAEAAIGLTFMGEAWLATAPEQYSGESRAEFDARLSAADPATDERRVEVLMVQTSYRDRAGVKMSLTRTREIVPGADGQPARRRRARRRIQEGGSYL